jgi:hypothetical protein
MGTRFGAPRVRFDWRGFITPAVKILVLTCAGVFLVQTLIAIFSVIDEAEEGAALDEAVW